MDARLLFRIRLGAAFYKMWSTLIPKCRWRSLRPGQGPPPPKFKNFPAAKIPGTKVVELAESAISSRFSGVANWENLLCPRIARWRKVPQPFTKMWGTLIPKCGPRKLHMSNREKLSTSSKALVRSTTGRVPHVECWLPRVPGFVPRCTRVYQLCTRSNIFGKYFGLFSLW